VKYQYFNVTGELGNISLLSANGGLGQNLWSLKGKNARGQLEYVRYGNNVLTVNTYDPMTGLLTKIGAGPAMAGIGGLNNTVSNSIVNQEYDYNILGHLTRRANNNLLSNEIFSYDGLNRLTNQVLASPGISPARSVSYRYNAIGNLLENSDIGKYSYGTASAGSRPHALASISGQAGKLLNPQYNYDARGNILTATASNAARRDHSWTSFDNPGSFSLSSTNAQGAKEQAQTAFLYGPEHQRIRETSSKTVTNTAGINTLSVNKQLAVLHPDNEGSLYFERETSSSFETLANGRVASSAKTENRHYISAPNAAGQGASAFLVITSPGAIVADPLAADLPSTEQRYLHKDQLGSTIATTKPSYSGTAVVGATIIEQLAYEPFGKRRYPAGQFDQTGQIDAQSTPRGFTGHEHLDDLDLIHMNARVYDPDIGRFLSPDPTVPFSQNPQAFNRYAYALNSPTNLVDRNGFEPRLPNGQGGSMHIYTSGDAPVNAPNNAANGAGRTAAEPKGGDGGKAQSGFSQFMNSTGKFAPRNDQSGSPGSLLKDSGRAMWNASLTSGASAVAGPAGGMLAAYVTAPLRFDYDTPNYGYAAEVGLPVLAGMGTARLPGLVTNLVKGEAAAANTAVPDGKFYSVAFETTLSPTSYPGITRYMHFKEANIALDISMQSNPALAKLGISVPKSPTGSIIGKSPENWVWHHDTAPGSMQLVPKSQHPNTPGGSFWETLHPGGSGGFSSWGKE
jgi:RHS repeat-associated protein